MKTKVTIYWQAHYEDSSNRGFYQKAIEEAAQLLQTGQTVAFPTETVYGLGADATNTEAVKRIFEAKGRPSDNPLIVHIADRAQLEGLTASVQEPESKLMEVFWPGPLTLVLPAKAGAISPLVTAGLSTVGVRMPDHPVALDLIRAADRPIAAPSANRSGKPSPTLAQHVKEDLGGRIGGLLDGGQTGVGLESTVVQWANGELHILRPGGVTKEELQAALPGAIVRQAHNDDASANHAPRAPGMKYTHYAPKGVLTIVQPKSATESAEPPETVIDWICSETAAAKSRGERTGILTFDEHLPYFQADLVVSCGSLNRPETVAHGLYKALREFDRHGVTFILAQSVPETGIGAAVMNRLLKAAGHRIVRV
jgi:L-threonylcarbamoyladenylate synthase